MGHAVWTVVCSEVPLAALPKRKSAPRWAFCLRLGAGCPAPPGHMCCTPARVESMAKAVLWGPAEAACAPL